MQPDKFIEAAFDYIKARNQLRAYVTMDSQSSYRALALALIASGYETEEAIYKEVELLADEYAASEFAQVLLMSMDLGQPWGRRKDGTLYLSRQ